VKLLTIVEDRDELEDVRLGFVPGSIGLVVNTITPQSHIEAFSNCLVEAIASASHAYLDLVFYQLIPHHATGVLTTVIGSEW